MVVSLLDLVRTEFKTSRAADDMNTRLQGLLALPHRYGPARLALGRSLGIPTAPTIDVNHLGYGKPIRGEHLFGQGEDLATWVTLIVEHASGASLERKHIQSLVGAHWQRGIYLLWDDWKASGDFDAFVGRLVRHTQNKGRQRTNVA